MSSVFFVLTLAVISALLCQGKTILWCGTVTGKERNSNSTKCLAGYYTTMTNGCKSCEKCPPETFTEFENTLTSCLPCFQCDSKENKVETKPCTPIQDRECGCKNGFYKKISSEDNWKCEHCSECNNCSKCPECKDVCTKLCGQNQKGTCQPCATLNCLNNSCQPHCEPVHPSTPVKLMVTLSVLLPLGLLAVCFICCACRRKEICVWAPKKEVTAEHNGILPHVRVVPDLPGETSRIQPLQNLVISSEDQERANIQRPPNPDWSITANFIIKGEKQGWIRYEDEKEMWPAVVLYTIIKEVPVRRWKEFLRLLSVSDDQMERVEMETGLSYLERQYQMLRLWSQRSGVSLDNIYSTLHCMDLSGCAQVLQEKLQQLMESMKAG